MALFGYGKRFAPMVKNGLQAPPDPNIRIKRQTIRAKRRDGKNAHPGETLHHYTGLRTKSYRKLGISICKSVEEITIEANGINVAGTWLHHAEVENLAFDDGFDSFEQLLAFFETEHGLPFWGLLTKW
jgi:hypothetical protein